MAIEAKPPKGIKADLAPGFYTAIRSAITALGIVESEGTVLRRKGSRPGWALLHQESFEGKHGNERFEFLLRLEESKSDGRNDVLIYGVRIEPRNRLPEHTQHTTFNSKHKDENGFYLQTHFPRTLPRLRKALEAELSNSNDFPSWLNGRVYLGKGTPRAIIERFLAATSHVARLKDLSPEELDRLSADSDRFTVSDLRDADGFAEGHSSACRSGHRPRSG
jgi:hypothetical protein